MTTTTMMRVRRVALGAVVAAFSFGVIATATSGVVANGAGHSANPASVTHVTAAHVWGS